MFGKKQKQVIKLQQDLCNANFDDNEVLFVRVDDVHINIRDILLLFSNDLDGNFNLHIA